MTTPRPRVLVLTTTFPATEGDNIPPFVLNLALAMSDDVDLTVLTPRMPGAPVAERIGSIAIERFPYFPERFEGLAGGATLSNLQAQPWRLPEFACLLARFHLEARRAVKRLEPDLVHAHWLLPSGVHAAGAAGVGGRGRNGRRVPVLATIHGLDVNALPVRPIEAVRRRVLHRCDHVVAVSSALARRVEALSPRTPVTIVPMGADLTEVPEDFTRSPEDGLIGFVGRLAEEKGVRVLLDAVAAAPGLRLVVAGDGPERSALEAQVERLQITDRVEFLGHADRRQVYELLSRSEALAIPSVVTRDGDQEGTPAVLAEAVALGVPVIASRLGGIADQLTDESGWLVAPGDAADLATTLAHAHGSPIERESRATTARKLIGPTLTLEGTAKAYTEIYQALVPRPPTS